MREAPVYSVISSRFFVFLYMTKPNTYKLDFEIDKLTDSILNRISGDSFRTEVSLLTKEDLKTITKLRGWSLIGNTNSISLLEKCIN